MILGTLAKTKRGPLLLNLQAPRSTPVLFRQTPGPPQETTALPDTPAKDAVTVPAVDAGPPDTRQSARPLLSTVTAGEGDEKVQVAEGNTVVVPSL